jgi:hypothetical protein
MKRTAPLRSNGCVSVGARWVAAFSAKIALAAIVPSCGAASRQPVIEDEARRMSPIPACIVKLPPRRDTGTLRRLRQEQMWSVVYPAFDVQTRTLPDGATTCTGRRLFDEPIFEDAERLRPPNEPVTDEDILVGSGGDQLRVAWLMTHRRAGGHLAGALALLRAKAEVAEVYAVGTYQARTARPYFVLERMGPEVLVTARDEACRGVRPLVPCEDTTSLFIARKGKLVELGAFPVERRAFASGTEKGAPGTIEYRLTSSIAYVAGGIRVFEQVVARDPEGRELRRAEIDRAFAFREVELVTTEPPLWPQIFPGAR